MTDKPTHTELQAPIEVIARAIATTSTRHILGPALQKKYTAEAEYVLKAIEEAGYAVVPVEPTIDMCEVGFDIERERYAVHHPQEDKCAGEIWEAMLAARPR